MKEAEIHFALAGDSSLLEEQSILPQQEYSSKSPQRGASLKLQPRALGEAAPGETSSSTWGAGLNASLQQAGLSLLEKEDLFDKPNCDQNKRAISL